MSGVKLDPNSDWFEAFFLDKGPIPSPLFIRLAATEG